MKTTHSDILAVRSQNAINATRCLLAQSQSVIMHLEVRALDVLNETTHQVREVGNNNKFASCYYELRLN
jgi:hypothetical protein